MAERLKLLIIEDSAADADLIALELERSDFEVDYERVESAEALQDALSKSEWDLVIADYKIPGFGGLEAFELFKEDGNAIPFIMVSGEIGEETAVEAMRTGVNDYVMKGNLRRLVPAVRRELRDARIRREKEAAEKRLAETQRRYRMLIDNAGEGVTVTQGGRIRFANPRAFEMVGMAEEEVIGSRLLSFVHPKDREGLFSLFNEMTGYGGRRRLHNFRIRNRDGELRWVECSIVPIEWDGEPAELSLFIDITERKEAEYALRESEHRFSSFMEHLPGAAFIKDQESRLLYMNAYTAEEFGWDPEKMIGSSDMDRWPKETAHKVRAMDKKVLETGRTQIEVSKFRSVNGEKSLLLFQFPLYHRGEDHQLIGGIAIDITRRVEAEEELRRTTEQLDIEREALERKNVALKEVLARIDEEKEDIKRQIGENIEEAVLPTLHRLKESSDPSQRRNFEMLEAELNEIARPFLSSLKTKYSRLTPRETEICRLIKNGMTSKEIAEALMLSPMTIHKYRELIRKKLGLVGKDINLGTYLKSI